MNWESYWLLAGAAGYITLYVVLIVHSWRKKRRT